MERYDLGGESPKMTSPPLRPGNFNGGYYIQQLAAARKVFYYYEYTTGL
jgi:hypothetical protein